MADAEEKRALMKETRDRTIDKLVPVFPGEHVALPLRIETSPVPRIEPIGFRSFDRQYLIADQRVLIFVVRACSSGGPIGYVGSALRRSRRLGG